MRAPLAEPLWRSCLISMRGNLLPADYMLDRRRRPRSFELRRGAEAISGVLHEADERSGGCGARR